MTDGEWMEVAREFAGHKYISVDLLARAMAMVAEETWRKAKGPNTSLPLPRAAIIAGLRAQLKSKKGL